LQEAAGRVAEVEAGAAKTAKELAEFKAESAGLRNQDLTLRKMEEKNRALEAQLAEKVPSDKSPVVFCVEIWKAAAEPEIGTSGCGGWRRRTGRWRRSLQARFGVAA